MPSCLPLFSFRLIDFRKKSAEAIQDMLILDDFRPSCAASTMLQPWPPVVLEKPVKHAVFSRLKDGFFWGCRFPCSEAAGSLLDPIILWVSRSNHLLETFQIARSQVVNLEKAWAAHWVEGKFILERTVTCSVAAVKSSKCGHGFSHLELLWFGRMTCMTASPGS